ncbi:MAG: polyphosphate kinase 2 [Candidatus Marinimicrobia bacterium]|nr:polyphosphate kinase 2 [Candidatus Neomarinimicrobiota bacterium]|tara:strand:- start:6662 stop:7447 length:786 start_codon:yes stop_codon:yes gene_type:complete
MSDKKDFNKKYKKKIADLHKELVKMQEWVIQEGKKIVIIFEGRDAAGKGGTIKRVTENLNPRHCRVVALAAPTEKEKTQWYFQRYVAHLPSAGEIVILDRSWYNRSGVEKVMGFCTDKEYINFLQTCPEFERMIISSGIQLIKYWFSVSAEEQIKRFQSRIDDPTKEWKLSPMDLESVNRWNEYSEAKDNMLEHTDTEASPWYIVESDNKKKARVNCITHLLSLIQYSEVENEEIKLPNRAVKDKVDRPDKSNFNYVPEIL